MPSEINNNLNKPYWLQNNIAPYSPASQNYSIKTDLQQPQKDTFTKSESSGRKKLLWGAGILATLVIAGTLIYNGVRKGKGLQEAANVVKQGTTNIVHGESVEKTIITEISGSSQRVMDIAPLDTLAAKRQVLRPKNIGKTIAPPVTQINPYHQKSQDMLIELYTDVVKKARAEGNTKRVQSFQRIIDDIKKGDFTPEEIYTNLLKEEYAQLRIHTYRKTASHSSEIAKLTGADTEKIQVLVDGGWHYRLPKNRRQQGWSTADKSIERISLNVNAEEALVKKLDEYFASGNVKGYFKTPQNADDWLQRHDPITIYLHQHADKKMLDEITAIVQPHIRNTDDVLKGHKFAQGCALEVSPEADDIQKILDRALKIDHSLEKILRANFTRHGKLVASAGEIHSANKIINTLTGKNEKVLEVTHLAA